MLPTTAIAVQEQSQVGEARRAASALAQSQGLDETVTGKIAIVATELANNLALHGGGGHLLLRCSHEGTRSGVEALAVDKGRGMVDVRLCQTDGYSTGGTAGTGLGAVRRLSDFSEIYSLEGRGTVVLSRIYGAPAPNALVRPAPPMDVGAVSVALPGETDCGDSWCGTVGGGACLYTVVDGLGHGPLAGEAAREAVAAFGDCTLRPPGEIVQAAHERLRRTRGAAMAVASVDLGARKVKVAGVGNIAVFVARGAEMRGLASLAGIVGHEVRKVQTFETEWPDDGLLIMHSDGLGTHWRLNQYAGLSLRDPAVIAAVLFRDHWRGRDDVTVLVARARQEALA